jgi:hypothetical protein
MKKAGPFDVSEMWNSSSAAQIKPQTERRQIQAKSKEDSEEPTGRADIIDPRIGALEQGTPVRAAWGGKWYKSKVISSDGNGHILVQGCGMAWEVAPSGIWLQGGPPPTTLVQHAPPGEPPPQVEQAADSIKMRNAVRQKLLQNHMRSVRQGMDADVSGFLHGPVAMPTDLHEFITACKAVALPDIELPDQAEQAEVVDKVCAILVSLFPWQRRPTCPLGITYARLHPLPALKHHLAAWGLMSKEGMQLVNLLAQGVDIPWFNASKLMQEMQEVIRAENTIAFGAEVRAFVMQGLVDWNTLYVMAWDKIILDEMGDNICAWLLQRLPDLYTDYPSAHALRKMKEFLSFPELFVLLHGRYQSIENNFFLDMPSSSPRYALPELVNAMAMAWFGNREAVVLVAAMQRIFKAANSSSLRSRNKGELVGATPAPSFW